MKASDSIKPIKSGFDLSTHSLFSAIAEVVRLKVEQDTGVKLTLQGKAGGKGKITATLLGQDLNPAEDLPDKVRQTMDALKNPSTLIDGLKK